jgi:hypothetical protein
VFGLTKEELSLVAGRIGQGVSVYHAHYGHPRTVVALRVGSLRRMNPKSGEVDLCTTSPEPLICDGTAEPFDLH